MAHWSAKRSFTGVSLSAKNVGGLAKAKAAEADEIKWIPRPAAWEERASLSETSTKPEGFRLIDLEHLFDVIQSAFVCKHCLKGPITFGEKAEARKGWCNSLRFYCKSCRTTTEFYTSRRTEEQGQGQSYEVNRRACVAASLAGSR